ncbi:MAG: glycosyltransferase family 4 protein [Vicinamibacterales bacterium]
MHVAFFNRSFYPDATATGQFLTELSADLVREHGCRVTVVVGPPLLPTTTVRTHGWGLFTRDEHQGVTVFRTRGTTFSKDRFAGRAANYMTYFLTACYAGLRLDRPDVLVGQTDPPIIGLAAWLAGKRFGVPFVMAFKDLFPEVTVLVKDFQSDAVNRVLQAANRFLTKRAARVLALGEMMRRRLIEDKGAPAGRTEIIPDWVDTGAIVPGPKRNPFSEAHGLAEAFVVMYSGNIGLSQGLESVIEAARLLSGVPDIRFVLVGEGANKAALQARVAALTLANVTFLPFVPVEGLRDAFASADVFLVPLQRGMAGYIVPSKLYGILAAGRPYVAAVEDDCEVAAITRTHACGLVAEPGNAEDLAAQVRVLHGDRAMAARYGENARAAALAFDRRIAVGKYMAVFTAVHQERRAS